MELDDLKKYWNQQPKVDATPPDPESIRKSIHNKSVGIIERIRRSLLIEIIFCCLALVGMLVGMYYTHQVLIAYYLQFFIGLSVLMMVVLFWILRSSNQVNPDDTSIKNNLIRIHTLVSRFARSYFIFTMALFPPVILYSLYAGASEQKYLSLLEVYDFYRQLPPLVVFFSIGFIVLSGILLYFFTRWYIRTLYGNYLDKLRQLIAELNSPES